MSSSPGRRPDFDRLARRYDSLRPAGDGWWKVFDALVEEGDLHGRRVLDVGCGTGLLAQALVERESCKVWGVDLSEEMVAVARERGLAGAGFRRGEAEELPFKDGWFERAVARLTVHLWDRPRGYAELRRVVAPGGTAAIATFDPTHFDGYWLNELFPSLEAIDRARFPDEAGLETGLASAGFEPRLVRLDHPAEVTRETALERIRSRHISTLELLEEDEYLAGLERAEAELPERIAYEVRWLVAVGS